MKSLALRLAVLTLAAAALSGCIIIADSGSNSTYASR